MELRYSIQILDVFITDKNIFHADLQRFITETTEQFGDRGDGQTQQILEQSDAMFAGGKLSDEDKTDSHNIPILLI